MGIFSKKEKKEKIEMQFKNISGLMLNRGDIVFIKKEDNGILISNPISNYELRISYNDITNISSHYYTEEEIENKSVIGRAIVGGVLTGGIGAIVGGMSGVGSKKKSKKVPAFEIGYIKNGVESTILLEDYWLIGTQTFMDSIRVNANSAPKITSIENSVDIPEQLEKLAKLKEQGIITEEEFTLGKAKLLKN